MNCQAFILLPVCLYPFGRANRMENGGTDIAGFLGKIGICYKFSTQQKFLLRGVGLSGRQSCWRDEWIGLQFSCHGHLTGNLARYPDCRAGRLNNFHLTARIGAQITDRCGKGGKRIQWLTKCIQRKRLNVVVNLAFKASIRFTNAPSWRASMGRNVE